MKKILAFLKKRWYLVLILVLAVGGYFYQSKKAEAVKKKENFYEVKRQDIKETLSLSGEIDAEEKAVLRFQTSGLLNWVGVKEGDYVKKHQGIASLDQRDVRKKMQKGLNDFVSERDDYDQSYDDNKRMADQPTQEARDEMKRLLEKAQYDLNNAVLDVELNQLAIEYSYLTSPIEGIVTRVDVKYPGVNITPAGAEFEIINPKTIYFSVAADQTDIISLQEGKEGDILLDAFEEMPIKGKVKFIAYTPKIGETGTVYKVKMLMESPGDLNRYRIGMTGDADFLVKERKNVLVVPTNLVKTEKNKKYVEKQVDGKKIKSFIDTTDEIDGNYVVTGGLKESDLIYTAK